MATKQMSDEKAVLEPITFPRKEKMGVVLGLDGAGVVSVFLCMVWMILTIVLVPFPWGILICLVVIVPVAVFLGWARFKGKRVFTWAFLAGQHLVGKMRGQNQFARATPQANAEAEARMSAEAAAKDEKAEKDALEWGEEVPPKTPKPIHLWLPGAADELKAYRTPEGLGVVHDPVRNRLIVTAKMNTRTSYTLQDDFKQGSILDNWANLTSMICSNPVVVGAIPTDVTTVITGEQMQQFYLEKATAAGAGAALNPVAHQGYLDLLAESDMTHHPQYFTIALSIASMKTEAKHHGSGMNGLLAAAEARMHAFEKDMDDNGFSVDHWVTAEERAGLLYDAFSPSPMGVVEGMDVSRGGPVGAYRYWDRLRADEHWHRTFVVEEWPQKPTRPGFMEKVILDLKFRHAVSLVHRAGDDDAAMRQVNRQIKDAELQQNLSRQTGRRVTLEMEREMQDHRDREEELVSGATDMRFRGFISITADSEEDLDRYTNQLKSAAARAHLKIDPCYGQQFEGFMAATALLGFGLD